jgi:16S rRNA (adenine(1408)-N(1))-methyltransferase
VVVDLGTGDGRAVLARAVREPASLVIGIDAAPAAMAESSGRAARRGPENARFFAAGAESLAGSPLAGRVDLLTVTFPWGSLLRGILGLEPRALAGAASLLAPGGMIVALASVVPSDGIAGLDCLDERHAPTIDRAWADAGLIDVTMRPAQAEEIEASASSWARRLRTGAAARPVWRLEGQRAPVGAPAAPPRGGAAASERALREPVATTDGRLR